MKRLSSNLTPWKFIITSLIIVATVLYFTVPSHAKQVLIGTFDETKYFYDDSTIVYEGNIRLVWVATTDEKFNYLKDKEYAGAAGRFAIDCSGHTSVFIEGFTLDKKGKILQHGTVPEEKQVWSPLMAHTPEYALYRDLCATQPIVSGFPNIVPIS